MGRMWDILSGKERRDRLVRFCECDGATTVVGKESRCTYCGRQSQVDDYGRPQEWKPYSRYSMED